ncbi:ATP synthase subunit b, mitochondrial-like [Anthonomus grandis grandis]|uniref:ATP synthase subunit b, mitochondrial-like n=1 Tax=Anthonomus grandis grandis TaxID=2921223 RepID=UPI0021650B15|nr:ATP synthase subunit b, mitochondrial-like [Anthonomus grandis grandis]
MFNFNKTFPLNKRIIRFYCKKTPTNLIELKKAASTKDASTECAKFEERCLKQVSLEKEVDANLQSRLSKECRILFTSPSNKSPYTKCGAIHLDKSAFPKNSQDWITYDFDQAKVLDTGGTLEMKSMSCLPEVTIPVPPQSAVKISDVSSSQAAGSGTGSYPNRPIRQEPGKVLFAFIPIEWWQAFIPKTGVTGFGMFLFTLGTFLVSKEIYVLEHFFYHGLSSAILWFLGIKYMGPHVAQFVDKKIDAYEKQWNTGRVQAKEVLEENIMDELHGQFQMDGQLLLIAAKRENVLFQLEEEMRSRQMYAYKEVKKRLDYQVAVELVRQRVQQRNLIEYVTREVTKAVTPEMQNELIYYSIDRIMQDLEKDKKENK